MKLSNQTLQGIKLHYQEEFQKTLKHLKELEQVLKELDSVQISLDPVLETSDAIPVQEGGSAEVPIIKAEEKPKRSYKKRSKKRGRKSVWGDFVLKRLRAVNRPLTYDDLTNHAQVSLSIAPSEFDKTRKALLGAVFQLRSKQNKVATFKKSNSRDKYVLLVKWLDEEKKPIDVMKAYME